jgi:hypothetical protein
MASITYHHAIHLRIAADAAPVFASGTGERISG